MVDTVMPVYLTRLAKDLGIIKPKGDIKLQVKPTIAALATITMLGGCAAIGTRTADPAIANLPTVTMGTAPGGPYIEQVDFSFDVGAVEKPLPLCIAQNVNNRAANVSGETYRYTSPYTGITYSDQDTSSVGGGEVLSYVSEDEKSVVARGTTEYAYTFALTRVENVVLFSLNADLEDSHLNLSFKDLAQASKQSVGEAPGRQRKLWAWEAAGAQQAYASIEEVAEDLRDCL